LGVVLLLPFGVAAAAGHVHGSLDPSFGSRGVVKTTFGPDAFAHALAIQKDGKLVAAGEGTKEDLTSVFALSRYGRDGSLDRTFGVGGKVVTPIGSDDAVGAELLHRYGAEPRDQVVLHHALMRPGRRRLQRVDRRLTTEALGGKRLQLLGRKGLTDLAWQGARSRALQSRQLVDKCTALRANLEFDVDGKAA
jgi:hypothetical protein